VAAVTGGGLAMSGTGTIVAAVVWAVVVALALLWCFLMAVAGAFGRHHTPGRQALLKLILAPGKGLAEVVGSHPAVIVGGAWLAWTGAGVLLLVVLHLARPRATSPETQPTSPLPAPATSF
jgi:hypothetical protein